MALEKISKFQDHIEDLSHKIARKDKQMKNIKRKARRNGGSGGQDMPTSGKLQAPEGRIKNGD